MNIDETQPELDLPLLNVAHIDFGCRHYLHMSDAMIEKQKDVVDAFGDSYMDAVTPEEIVQVCCYKK